MICLQPLAMVLSPLAGGPTVFLTRQVASDVTCSFFSKINLSKVDFRGWRAGLSHLLGINLKFSILLH